MVLLNECVAVTITAGWIMLLFDWQCLVRNIAVSRRCHVSCCEPVKRQQLELEIEQKHQNRFIRAWTVRKHVARMSNINPQAQACDDAKYITPGWLALTDEPATKEKYLKSLHIFDKTLHSAQAFAEQQGRPHHMCLRTIRVLYATSSCPELEPFE
jgi:hypothetical protein